jgi:two-component system phosphate regulon sensor histidine kinase PhoR
MKGVFYCTDTSYNNIEVVLRDYNLSIINQQKIISGILSGHSRIIKRLYLNLQGGWRKIEPFSSPKTSKLLYFVFITDNYHGNKTLCGIIIDVQEFVNQVLSQKIQAIVEDRFIISVLKNKEKKVIYSSEPITYNQVSHIKPLWLLPDLKMGIIFKGRTIEQLVRDRTYINFVMIILLDILFLCGTWFVFRSIKNEIQLAKMRADFISNVSHEIRTPLSLISLYIETIIMGRVKPEKLQHYYLIIHQETDRLIGIVNKILNFSKIEEKKLIYNFSPINLNEVIEVIMDRYNY